MEELEQRPFDDNERPPGCPSVPAGQTLYHMQPAPSPSVGPFPTPEEIRERLHTAPGGPRPQHPAGVAAQVPRVPSSSWDPSRGGRHSPIQQETVSAPPAPSA